ncbi:glycosyltransferase family 4 protein [Acidisphaera rubrifaciens]|uniref:Glycosyl transferase n=1 Tax=Acidisphaera rubrifaciens HS-AP3 TaxID=1231350 RepID=A0A0D6P9Y3_9PROT|nr:glycosyltransferase family 4 protein [Acidisphaera rubrifaciens]GAN77664.1 glycosyl transferase [Acidisphaera rubrifaciens HS-AP3]
MDAIRLLTFSTLYPNNVQPNHGVFVENRLRHLIASHRVESVVVAPVPYFPSTSAMFGGWSRYARVTRHELRHGLTVHHPRYAAIPRVGTPVAPFLLYRGALRAIRGLMREGLRFDAIDAHYLYPDGVAATWLAQRLGCPVVLTARGSDVTQLPDQRIPRLLIRRAIARADALIAVSAAIGQALTTLGAPDEKVHVLRNGVDCTIFRPVDRAAARAALGLTRTTLLSVGHLIPRKGHHLVVEAMAELPDCDLVIVGDGPEREALRALIARCGLGGRVRLLGAQPHADLPRFYTAADALVLASSREGWANVLLEAMACGTPVIASNIPGNPEVVQRREAGRILRANTLDGIAAAARELLADPPDRAATRAYASGYSWDATSAGQFALFAGLVRPAAPRIRVPGAITAHHAVSGAE